MSPLLVMQRAETFEEAVELCNGVRHGLAAALFSPADELQKKFIAEAHAGISRLIPPPPAPMCPCLSAAGKCPGLARRNMAKAMRFLHAHAGGL